MHIRNKTKKEKIELNLFSEFRLIPVAPPAIWLFINISNINVFQ